MFGAVISAFEEEPAAEQAAPKDSPAEVKPDTEPEPESLGPKATLAAVAERVFEGENNYDKSCP